VFLLPKEINLLAFRPQIDHFDLCFLCNRRKHFLIMPMRWIGAEFKKKLNQNLENSFIHNILYAQNRYAYGCCVKDLVDL